MTPPSVLNLVTTHTTDQSLPDPVNETPFIIDLLAFRESSDTREKLSYYPKYPLVAFGGETPKKFLMNVL